MSIPLQPDVRVLLEIQRDGSPGTETRRCSTKPLGDAEFTEGRVPEGGWVPVRRELSDDQGQPRMATGGVVLNDDDGALRAAITENETRFVTHTEASIQVLSKVGREAALDWRYLLRGRVEEPSLEIERNGNHRKRRVRLDLIDALAPYYDQTIPEKLFLRSDWPDIHRDIENTPIPLIGGEHSDAGAEDVNGNSAEKGMCPAIHVGTIQTIDDVPTGGSPVDTEPAFLQAPADLEQEVESPSVSGSTDYYYGVTALSAVGQTLLSAILHIDDGPAVLSAASPNIFSFEAVEDAVGYVIYGRRNPTPVRRLRVIDASGGAGSPARITFTDDGTDVEHAPGPPDINTAQIDGPAGTFFWDFYVIALGYVTITGLYASHTRQGVEPGRELMEEGTYGVDFLMPTYRDGTPHPSWPFPDPWLTTASGLQVTGFFGRGPRSHHHKENIVTMAVSTCGYEDVGDGTGLPIQRAFPMLQHFCNNFMPLDGLPTYAAGTWLPLREFSDGTSILRTSAFESCQTLTESFMAPEGSPANGDGYLAHIYLREPITIREFLRTFCETFDSFIATNHHGQIYPVLCNPLADATDGRIYRERIEIARLESPQLDKTHIEPRVAFQYDWDPDAGRFRSEVEIAQDVDAVAVQKFRDRGVKLLRFTRDGATARDAMYRRVLRLRYPRWKQTVVCKFSPGLEDELGDQIRITHPDGALQDGWTERPFMVTAHVVDPNRGEVWITGFDLYPLLTTGWFAEALEDESVMDGNLFDEESDQTLRMR